jgi:hypothetical protein
MSYVRIQLETTTFVQKVYRYIRFVADRIKHPTFAYHSQRN